MQILPISALCQTSVMSFNIRYDNPNDDLNWWGNRKLEIAKTINYYAPEIVGIQEGLDNQVKYLDSALVDYNYTGVGRDDGKSKGEYAAIFYKKKKFKLLKTKTYWLSETPDSVSVGWDASMERIATFGEFLDKIKGDTLSIFNCHFDHIGKLAQYKSAELILKIIEEKRLEGSKVIVMGDLNCEPHEKPIKTLKTVMKDAYNISQSKPYGPIGTYNAFNLTNSTLKRIDYIFVKNIQVLEYINIEDRRTNNMYLSDHLPILIKIE